MKKVQFVMSGVMMVLAITMTSCVSCWKEQTLLSVDITTEQRQLTGFE